MAGEEWANEPEVPKKKGGLPKWLWFCGGGCLIAVVLAAIAGMFMVRQIKEAADPEKQWGRVAEYIEYDARPTGWSIFGLGMVPGMDGFVFMDLSSGRSVNWMILPASEASSREEIFNEDFDGGGIPQVNQLSDTELGELEIQGRTLQVLRFTQNALGTGKQICAFVDITPEEEQGLWLLQIVLPPGSGRVSDEFVRDFLAPFHIGPERELYIPGEASDEEGGGHPGVEIQETLELPEESPEVEVPADD